jgi:serine/threonine protein kinase
MPLVISENGVWWKENNIMSNMTPNKVFIMLSQNFINPVTNKPLSSSDKSIVVSILRKQWPVWFGNIELLLALKTKEQKLLNAKDPKIGSGRFGTVYESSINGIPVAIKKVERSNNDSGHNECYILTALRDLFLIPKKTVGIIWLYKYLPGDLYDLAVMEKATTSFWKRLVSTQKPKARWLKAVMFQVFYTLVVMQIEVPSFRHNDLKVDNILLIENECIEPFELSVPSDVGDHNNDAPKKWVWDLPVKEKVLVKITDFDYACMEGIKNIKVDTEFSRKFGCESTPNHFYDAHVFLNSLYRHASTMPKEVVRWIERQVPKHLMGDTTAYLKYGRLINPSKHENELKTAEMLLFDPFFQ